jgi:hypothetical protein
MFQYKRTMLREHSMPGLKPTARDKPLLTWFYSLCKLVTSQKSEDLKHKYLSLPLN